jgi:stearoyl-CoA desaturase (Delta-9 desaturase)
MAASYALSSQEREFSSRAALTIPIHVFAFGALFTGARAFDWVVLLVLYAGRMFFLTAGYHRYFAHRAFRTSRFVQFLLAWGGCTALQRGPLWWAGHHRRHHRYSDRPLDVHSPKKGLYWSHYGWVLGRRNDATPLEYVRDFGAFPELRWLNTYYFVPGLLLMASVFAAGWLSGGTLTTGLSALFVGFFLSTVVTYQTTYLVNSSAHIWGTRRFATLDTSRNNFIVALLTHGEGWHNNHHHCPHAANQGFYWWELDLSYVVIVVLEKLHLVWDVRRPTAAQLARHRLGPEQPDYGMLLDAREREVSRQLGRRLTVDEAAKLTREVVGGTSPRRIREVYGGASTASA